MVIRDKKEAISKGYKQIIAWQKSDLLAHEVYRATYHFPKAEMFGLTSQLRRAVLSIPTNIVEGYARSSKNEFHRFLSISLGSLAEVEYLEFSFKEKLISLDDFYKVQQLKEEFGRVIWSLYKSQE